ncbi:MAG: HAD-IIIA family hydrolase [Sphingobacteriales bacterium JAD_PAG50586_3]|nr:MAG: HAD-IIIA family hydrolase [Sphingobacteriales bacterium JAD_PAG50586_3]
MQELRSRDYIFIIITNQSGIAQDIYTHEEVHEVHSYIKEHFANFGIRFAEIYYCPHHPTVSKCLCRKPGSLLVEKGLARFDIDPAQSYFIGDRERDIEAAQAAGVNSILVPSNANLGDYLSMIA